MAYKNILLIGAGGNLGVHVLRAFLDAGLYTVSVLARKESTSVFPEGVKVFKADYANQSEVENAMQGIDVVVSMVAPMVASSQYVLIDAAIAAGVKRFLPSEFGPPTEEPEFAPELNNAVLNRKKAVVEYLRTKESEMSWTSIVTGAFFDWGMALGFFGMDLATKTAALVDDGTTVFSSSTLPYIAKAVIAALEHANETKNQYVYISSFNITQRDIVAALEKVQGQKWAISHTTSEKIISTGQKKMANGDHSGIIDLVRAGAMGKGHLADNSAWGLWDDKLGLKKDDLEQACIEVLSST
ncbi:hypothetical protein FALCPG4_008563 [Fusarium falciforme]